MIREIKFSGNKKIKTGDLLEAIDLKPRTILNINAVKENQNKILKKYQEEAYFAAEVEYDLETPRKGDVIVHFKIKENKKVRIQKITFSGNLHFSDTRLKKLLPETQEKDWLSWIRKTGIYKEDVLERDLDAVLNFYFQNGFLDAKIGKPVITIDAKGMTIQIPVEEGRQFKVGKVDIQGDLIAPKEELFKHVDLYVGEILNRDKIRDSVIQLTDRYADRGYAFADVNPQTIIHPEKDLVDIVFDIQQGNKVYFDRINITGNHKTRDKVIRRELKVQEGELYSLSLLKKSRDNLNYLGYFKEANVTTKKGAGEDKLDADVKVEEAPTGAFSLGGGYSSIDKFVGIVSVSQNNLFGLGQKLGVSAQIGAVSQYFNLGFSDPYFLDTRTSLGVNLYKTLRDYTEYVIERTGGEIRFGYPVFDAVRAYGGYRYEVDNITDIVQNASLVIQDAAGISRTSMLSFSLRRDTRNHYFDPTSGSDVGVSVDYAGGPLGGTNYFTRYGAEAKIFLTPDRRVTFMGRGIVGYIQPNEGHRLPLQERYRLGGIYSLRGFEAYSVGPKAANGEVIGGDKQLLFNVEAIFPIYSEIKLKGVVFFDAGNAFDVGEPIKIQDLRTSVGFGVRWISPVGPLRLEWGYNLSPKPGEKHSGWDFAIGTFF